jgi:hypothetical protein
MVHGVHFQRFWAPKFFDFSFGFYSLKLLCFVLKFYFVHISVIKFEKLKKHSCWKMDRRREKVID